MCLFLLPLKINPNIKQKLLEFGPKNAKLIPFSEVTYERPGGVWDALLAKWIKTVKTNRGDTDGSSTSSSTSPSEEDVIQERVARDLISSIEEEHNLSFRDSKFPLFGFMREVATNENKHPKLYLWQGEADAIACSWALEKTPVMIVEFKVVDNLSDYWEKKTDLCGKHLHQCLVYAKLLKLHMKLPYLPPSLIVVIHKVTGKEGYFVLFENYPKECYEKLDEFEWFTEQPPKRPLKIANTDKLLHENFRYMCRDVVVAPAPTKLSDIFGEDATLKDLLDSLGYDSLEIFRQER